MYLPIYLPISQSTYYLLPLFKNPSTCLPINLPIHPLIYPLWVKRWSTSVDRWRAFLILLCGIRTHHSLALPRTDVTINTRGSVIYSNECGYDALLSSINCGEISINTIYHRRILISSTYVFVIDVLLPYGFYYQSIIIHLYSENVNHLHLYWLNNYSNTFIIWILIHYWPLLTFYMIMRKNAASQKQVIIIFYSHWHMWKCMSCCMCFAN